ncbi:hypothetical protein DICVIV_11168 [Dictyocaulus viviparus]|uniref:Uncharacterized protein n=1 Tax=Dictyocaulus viviparus TaxID=29172 RepID=A0A0D8XGJ7_DICVI|nr:hypothetical protein DICVIV_11168 [Dictyocaulus viviparus]
MYYGRNFEMALDDSWAICSSPISSLENLLNKFSCIISTYVVKTNQRTIRRSSANRWPKWMGVMHGYEIEYMFGQPTFNSSLYDQKLLS